MSTLLADRIQTGSVLEIKYDDEWVSALVLLATPEAMILDLCDGSTPFVIRPDELHEFRVFAEN